MKMTRIEKRFVNRKKQSIRNIIELESALKYVDMIKIKTVLELGCGIGFVSHYLTETYKVKVCGTDYDKEQIQVAIKMQPKNDFLEYQVEDAANLSFQDSSIDLILAQNVFHHLPNWEHAIKEIARVLYSDGYFIWLDLTFPRLIKTIFLPLVKNYGLYTIDDMEKTFEVHEFKTLFHEKLVHGLFSQYHYVLQHN